MELSDINKARLEQAGSTLVHKSALARRIATRHFLKLEGLTDIPLRWRMGDVLEDEFHLWARTMGEQRNAGLDPSRWPNAVLGVHRQEWENLTSRRDLRPAAAYRIGSAATMIGIRELNVPVDFTVPINDHGQFDPNGGYRGVVMRTGGGFEGALGMSNEDGKHIRPLATVILARLGEMPEGLNRV